MIILRKDIWDFFQSTLRKYFLLIQFKEDLHTVLCHFYQSRVLTFYADHLLVKVSVGRFMVAFNFPE